MSAAVSIETGVLDEYRARLGADAVDELLRVLRTDRVARSSDASPCRMAAWFTAAAATSAGCERSSRARRRMRSRSAA